MVAIFTTAGNTRSSMGARLGNGSPPTDVGSPAVAIAIGNQQAIEHTRTHRRKSKIMFIRGNRLIARKRQNRSVEAFCRSGIIPTVSRGSGCVVGYAVGYVPGRNKLPRGIAVPALIVKINIGTKRAQEIALIETPEKYDLIDTNISSTQSSDNALVRRRTASRNKRCANGCLLRRILCLQTMQSTQKISERPAR